MIFKKKLVNILTCQLGSGLVLRKTGHAVLSYPVAFWDLPIIVLTILSENIYRYRYRYRKPKFTQ